MRVIWLAKPLSWLVTASLALITVGLVISAPTPINAYPTPYDPPPMIDLKPGNGSVHVAWPGFAVDANYVSAFKVDASPGNASCTTAINVDNCTIRGLENGKAYTFAVYVVGLRGFNGPPNIAGPVWPCCSIPDPPVNVQGVASQGAVVISWSPPLNAQAAGHDFTYTATSSPGSQQCITRETSCRIEGLEDGTGYVFQVSATNAGGPGPAANSPIITPLGPPGAPTNIRVFLKSRGVASVSWIAPAKTGGLVVDRYVATAIPGGATCETTGALSCDVSGLTNGKSYRFLVTAYNSSGAGTRSLESETARPLAGPSQPRKISVRITQGRAQISWQQPKSTGGLPIKQYKVRASPGGNTCQTKGRSCVINGLRPATTYVFIVEARNAKGLGAPAESRRYSTGRPPTPTVPTAPTAPTPVVPSKPEPVLS